MNTKVIVTFVLAITATAAVASTEAGYLVSMKIERDGENLGEPRLLTKSGVMASVQRGQELKIEVTPTPTNGKVQLALRLLLPSVEGLKPVATPKLIAEAGTTSSLEFHKEGEPRYRLTFVATEHALNVPVAPR